MSSTNLSVVKSAVTLAITSTPEGENLYSPLGTVYGTVSDPKGVSPKRCQSRLL